MMKWKARKETMNIGTLELGNLVFDEDYMELSLDIFDMSDELKAEIRKAVEIEKVNDVAKWDEWYKNHPECEKRLHVWSDKPAIIEFQYLRVVLNAGKPIDYSIIIGFQDAENDNLDACASITVDLTGYEDELKKAVIKVLIDRFF